MTLAHWRHIESRLVTLIILIEIDDSDNLLSREVVDVRLVRYIESADLRRRCAMDDEALLEIAETIIGGFIDNNTLRNFCIYIIRRARDSCIILFDCYGSNSLTLALFINGIIVTAIVVGLWFIDLFIIYCSRSICLSTCEIKHIDILLFRSKIIVGFSLYLLSNGIRNFTIHE